MRVGVWWSAAALAFLAVSSALRTTQGEGATRIGRRLPTASVPEEKSADGAAEAQPTFRPRGSRRRDDTTPREVVRTRTRSRPQERPEVSSEAPQSLAGRNERFDSRRTHSRTRSRTTESDTNPNPTPATREHVRSRTRANVRRTTSTTPSPPEVSSPTIDESKIEVIDSTLDDLARITPAEEKATTIDSSTQFRRRSSTTQTTEMVPPRRLRSRINTRPNARSLDLDISGTTNTLTSADKEPTTLRSGDLRNSRKLRYKTRLSETDTNLTGEGLKTQSEVNMSSQNVENVASQPEVEPSAAAIVDNSIQQSTEGLPLKSTTLKIMKMVRRPLTRGSFRSPVPVAKVKTSDEINEDDNYPESFKALIQAKNASTQASSPASESLSVKASQRVYKTYTPSSQATNTGNNTNKFSRYRNKLTSKNVERQSRKESDDESKDVPAPESPKPRSVDRQRATFTPRRPKSSFSPSSTSTSTTISSSNSSSTEKTQYKFNRKFKITTTQAPQTDNSVKPKRTEAGGLQKKTSRAYYQRKGYPKKNVTTEAPTESRKSDNNNPPLARSALPKTSYYSRLRNNRNKTSTTTTTTESVEEIVADKDKAQNKKVDTVDMPLIFTLLKDSDNIESSSEKGPQKIKLDDKEMFVIAVTSKESQESSNLLKENASNEVSNMAEESENNPIYNNSPTTIKYHANYKDIDVTVSDNNDMFSSTVPPVKNIQTRKYGRQRSRTFDQYEDLEAPKPREKGRKYSDVSKTTEASTNGINPETEKVRTRFSSKYRAPHVEKPVYKATVPTVTPSTAWLKFYVTDQLLTKSVEEPYWFDVDNLREVTTEPMSRQTITTQPIIHVSSIELVEGEEINLGPDMNSISFTKTRSTLSSADLRLSESLVKSSQVMNVEASHHSPSVTVSIFDALAEILTSTPRPRLSSTTEVSQSQYTTNDVKQTLNGVSNNINVNSVSGLSSQDTLTTTSSGINTNAKSVQNTDQTTPIVINRLSVGEGVTTSLNAGEQNVDSVNTVRPIPTPTPTTPVSARKPFAIRVLYSDTEPPQDRFTTATETSSVQPSTVPTMVYNTVSDLLLSNNNLVSSELTSMLSNNIRSILEQMDERSRTRVSSDMAELLKSLIPRAIDGLETVVKDADLIPNTTPYSLEDIKDTENIVINNDNSLDISNLNILQSVTPEPNVYSTVNVGTTVNVPNDISQAVNNAGTTPQTSSAAPLSTDQMTLAESSKTTVSLNNVQTTTAQPVFSQRYTSVFIDQLGTGTAAEGTQSTAGVTLAKSVNSFPIPFFTNFKADDFVVSNNDSVDADSNESITLTKTTPMAPVPASSSQDVYNLDTDDPSQVSRFQLWVLSKKARVLKMIEDLIRQHNDELATAQPLTEFIEQTNNIPLSDRLTRIMNTISSTTESTNTIGNNDLTTPMTTPFNTAPLSTSTESIVTNGPTTLDFGNGNSVNAVSTTTPDAITTTQTVSDIFSSLRFNTATESAQTTTGTSTEANVNDLPVGTTDQSTIATPNRFEDVTTTSFNTNNMGLTTNLVNDISTTPTNNNTFRTTINIVQDGTTTPPNTDSMEVTSQGNTESSTSSLSTETTTQPNLDMTTNEDAEPTTQLEIETTTATTTNPKKENIISAVDVEVSSAIKTTVPKKDYVIFGILPNNTVVRKDPNDDVLETLTEASPYIVYGVLPNNTVIRRFPNGTRVPRVMQKIDILPISPWSLRNPYSPIHNNPAIVRPQSNPIRVSTNIVTSTDTNNGTESRLTNDTVNNLQMMIPSSTLNIKDSSSLAITTNKPPTEKSTASHVLSLRTTTMLPSVDEILLNSISSAVKEEMVISMTTTREPRILTLDIDPETKQIRTEKPDDGTGGAVFKFIPIDEVMVAPQNSNVLKLATKVPTTTNTEKAETQTVTSTTVTEANTQTPQIQTKVEISNDSTTTTSGDVATPNVQTTSFPSYTATLSEITTTTEASTTTTEQTTTTSTTAAPTTTLAATTTTTEATTSTTTAAPTTTLAPTTTTTSAPIPTTVQTTTMLASTITSLPTASAEEERQYQQDAQILQELLKGNVRDPKNLNIVSAQTTTALPTARPTITTQTLDQAKLLEALLSATGQNSNTLTIPNIGGNLRVTPGPKTTTSRSIEDDIRQFEEDTKLLKALLQATGQNPANFNIPTLNINPTTSVPTTTFTPRPTTTQAPTTTTQRPTTTTTRPTTTTQPSTTQSIDEDLRKLQEDTQLLKALLQATGQNPNNLNLPIVTGVTSNVRIASNLRTTNIVSNPTTPFSVRPVYNARTTTQPSPVFTFAPRNIVNTLQTSTTDDGGISTTFAPFNQRRRGPTTTARSVESTTNLSGRRVPSSRFTTTTTTDIPSTSTFSVEEDLAFLKNLKTVLKSNVNNDDAESSLANRIIALAVERSLNEIQGAPDSDRSGKAIANNAINVIPTSTTITTTTTTTTTTTPRPTTTRQTTTRPTTTQANTPSLEDDIKQFQEDTKLLQALLKATGQDPSQFNIPTLPNITPTTKVSAKSQLGTNADLKLLSNLIASPSLLNEPFDSMTTKTNTKTKQMTDRTTARPFGAKIAVKDDLKSEQDDERLLKTLVKLQDVQETTTQRNKLAITGQTSDEALQKLLQNQQKPKPSMMSEATQAPMSLSTEFGKSNDALLAALLKEQGFGPTTASSQDEQLRLSALLNQVVVTPKARRTTTPPPPPPAPRRPILDGLAWLWQQWRETAPGPAPRPSRPSPSSSPTITSSASTSNRVNWFGSGPFVGNADDQRSSNRVPLDPPRAVTAEAPGRGQLVSAAINVTRAFSQFLGAAIQGAAQTVQSVIRAGQRAASDVYTNGSGGSG